jgi:glycosyltransferase involved in cell wall biosynthesis
MSEALLPEVGVVALVPDRWGDQWQPRHQVMSRLGRYFQVAWVNPAPDWRDVLADPGRFRIGDPTPCSGLRIHSPDWTLPRFYRPALVARGTQRMRWAGARRKLRGAGCRSLVLYLWRPDFEAAIGAAPWDLCCYHIDDEYTFETTDGPVPRQEARVIEAVDEVFIHSPALIEKKGSINPHTSYVPNGVDFEAHSTWSEEPEDLSPIPHPRAGYTGWLKNQLDWPLIGQIVAQNPEWSFVFVGAVRHPELEAVIARLARAPNVHFLGAKTSKELTHYPQHFDVCMMPYRVDGYTRYIYPLKLHEYLAGGRPVIGTPIRTLRDYEAVVDLATTPEEWDHALTRARVPGADARARSQARRSVAEQHDWSHIVEGVARRIAARLGAAPLETLEASLARARA